MATPPTIARNCGRCGKKIVSSRKTCSEKCYRRLQGYTREAKGNPDAIQDPGGPLSAEILEIARAYRRRKAAKAKAMMPTCVVEYRG